MNALAHPHYTTAKDEQHAAGKREMIAEAIAAIAAGDEQRKALEGKRIISISTTSA